MSPSLTTRASWARSCSTASSTSNDDAARDYAQQIPVRIVARVLDVPLDMSDTFTPWVRNILDVSDDDPEHGSRASTSAVTANV